MTSQKDLPDLYEASIAQLQAGLARGDFTSVQLTQAYLSRIQEVNSKLRCVVTTNPHALEAAAKADELRSSYKNISAKPLLGIPIAVKDNIATCAADGMATTASSLALKGAMAKEDSDVVSALKEAGAIILGKLSLSEWAYRRQRGHQLPSGWGGIQGQMTGAYGDQANPSGSSGGPAVATSVGLCAASLGTETFGSCVKGVRIWISVDLTNRTGSCLLLTVTMWLVCDLRSDWLAAKELCVLFSSPSILFMTDTGQIPISSNHDSVGPMTRCVEDAAIVLEALTNSRDYLKALNEDALKGKRCAVSYKSFRAHERAGSDYPSSSRSIGSTTSAQRNASKSSMTRQRKC
jgi:amidase